MVITAANENLAEKRFNNAMSRYKIDGNEVWEFYGKPNFEQLLFTATGPLGWTRIATRYNDMVSSVRPVKSK